MNAVKFTATGLSVLEKALIRKIFKNTNFQLDESMSSECAYVLAYRNTFTDKKILAEKWGIPVIRVDWVYKSLNEKNIKSFQMRKYEGCIFTTTGITNDLFVNYFQLQGGCYVPELGRWCDFLVAKNGFLESTKVEYARECGIPVIPAEEVFFNCVRLFQKQLQYDSFCGGIPKEELFNGLVFYFEGTTEIHKLVRQMIIEHGGNRVGKLASDVNYSVYFGGRSHCKDLVWYQWILDSVELGTLLSPDAYLVRTTELVPLPLDKVTAHLMVCKEESIRTKNKVLALGGTISMDMSSKVTHCIIEDKSKPMEHKTRPFLDKYKVSICTMEWLNQCIYHMKRIKEMRFEMSARIAPVPEASIPNTNPKRQTSIKCISHGLDSWKVQFTGLMDNLKSEAITVLAANNIAVIDSPEYSSECTHLIVGGVNVSLKFLSAIASGAVLLDYRIVDDLKRNRYTGKHKYSLETRSIKLDVGKNEGLVRKLIKCAPLWQKQRERTGKKAFAGWTVVILAKKNTSNIKQLLENGGGVVLSSAEIENHSHNDYLFFVDKIIQCPEGMPADKIIQLKDILSHLAGVGESEKHSPKE